MPVRHRLALLLLASLVLTTGCSGSAPSASPAPATRTPAPIETASDEAAFREAEATYRAYVDALNAVDLSDPATFEPVFALTTGELRASEENSLTSYHSQGASRMGKAEIISLVPDQTDGVVATIFACIDLSTVLVTAADGSSLVDATRADRQQFSVRLTRANAHERMRVSAMAAYSDGPAC